jgi:hypothetical protein
MIESYETSPAECIEDDRASRLLGSLLSVVENKLVEARELDEIRRQLEKWKEDVQLKEEYRRRQADETYCKIMNDLQEFREKVTGMVSLSEKTVATKIEHIETDVKELRLVSESMRRDLSDMRSSLPKNAVELFASRLQNLEKQMLEVQKKLENNSNSLKSDLSTSMAQVKGAVESSLEATQRRTSADLGQIKLWGQEEISQLKQQMDRIDTVFDNNAHSTP